MIKRLLTLIAIALVSLLFFVACGDVISENDDNEIATTQPQDFTTTTRTQNVDPTRVPYWAEGVDLDEDETLTVVLHVSELRFDNIDDFVRFGTDVVRVEALGEERVELINNWYPPPRESAYATRDETQYNAIPQQQIAESGNVIPQQQRPTFDYILVPEERYREHYDIFTVYRFRVLEVFQGTTQPGEIIEVMRRGGQYGRFTRMNNNWDNDFAAGDELVLFLTGGERYRNSYIPSWVPNPEATLYRIQNMPFSFLGSRQSVYRIATAGEDVMALNDKTVLESVHPENDLVLTMGDLARIAQAAR